ncbi:alcohol dehydrogenase [Candidatus Nitrosotenuis uzonensis]|uniref:NAD-dependent alcohol dehydrogenase n=1 Tax=Candidatus Nitrosotenuis uzonensis TaxID=1407055 RepID=A0A812F632_9ARCH|nr:alcohol dehydrogenase [Candidatus Nitrosotenuis uzonensis]CAE6500955.1 NAD-dependent alcohol dehydrogenase [Candidatus Nitrosotenuis uzonensis]
MKASQVIKTKEPLQMRELKTPTPKGKQVLVEIESAGVCHSDIHVWEGGYEGKQGQIMRVEDRGVKFPLTLGHEIAGSVSLVGGDVKGVKKGDRILVYPWLGDGTCSACQIGDEHVCDNPRSLGIFQNGGYAQKVLVPDEKYLVKIGDLDANLVSSLACSGLTSFTAVKNAAVSPKQTLVIIGAGGLGLMGVQIARALLNPTIIVIDIDNKKLGEAKKLGADHTVNSISENAINKVKELTFNQGADSIIDFVNSPKTVDPALNMLRKRGNLVLVGLFGGSIELNLPLLPLRSQTIIGSYTGRLADLADLVGLVKRKAVTPTISKTFKLEGANDALEQLKAGKILGRAVINPN